MKRYKHRKTGLIFKIMAVNQRNYYVEESKASGFIDMIPAFLVEDSCDFEELKEVLFVTEDGVEITDGKTILYYLYQNDLKSSGKIALENSAVKMVQSPLALYFSSTETRTKYVEENAPLLSKKDVMDLDYTKFNGNNIVIKIRELDDLVKEKLK